MNDLEKEIIELKARIDEKQKTIEMLRELVMHKQMYKSDPQSIPWVGVPTSPTVPWTTITTAGTDVFTTSDIKFATTNVTDHKTADNYWDTSPIDNRLLVKKA